MRNDAATPAAAVVLQAPASLPFVPLAAAVISLTLYATAGRAAEVQQLKRRDADREYVSVIGKRSKPRELFLTPEARHALKAYLAARGHDGNDALDDVIAFQALHPVMHGGRGKIHDLAEFGIAARGILSERA